ncbi:MAG: hypothetical protein KatS3mg110_2556 [Pirellulaceae bacterium]|nr:MAG: hypothetical protein KatS3mg110_2556 [Pirellulaceae bacterium]
MEATAFGVNGQRTRRDWANEPHPLRAPRTARWVAGAVLAWVCIIVGGGASRLWAQEQWKPANPRLLTRWAADVHPERVHPEYPRPQMRRRHWINLNGLWQYAIVPKESPRPASLDGHILVPFPVESSLSGVARTVGPENAVWYRRMFRLELPPDAPEGGRWLLHFGAVDWQCRVWVDGHEVGTHAGGYDPFTFEITRALQTGEEHELVVWVWDPTDAGFQPRGKQVRNPRGIWYTSVTGIWQTVWLEYVPELSIEQLTVTPDFDQQRFLIEVSTRGNVPQQVQVAVTVLDGERSVATAQGPAGSRIAVQVPGAKSWSPADPFLYGLRVALRRGGQVLDEVESYAALRKISLGKDSAGYVRLCLNNEPLFQLGLLDQGWWPDGLYTAPTDEALRYDLEVTRRLGYNMIRKHVKVEPARWYFHCDQLGLLVWQDMPNGDRMIGPQDPDIERTAESEEVYRREWSAIIAARRHHPSIVVWVPFNEGWGQFKTNEILEWTKQLDPTRLVDGPSGWADRGGGDMHDMHRYPGPAMPQPEGRRAVVLGEFGGLGLPVEGHLWVNRGNWGYRTYSTREELQENYETLLRRLRPLIARGLAAAVYTQTTDVEIEVNGVMTYDRAVIKLDPERTARLHRTLYQPIRPVKLTVLVPTSEKEGQLYRYSLEAPAGDWMQPEFDDRSWAEAPGGFGEPSTPGSVVRTAWKTDRIWLRRSFTLEHLPQGTLYLRVHHDEDADVFLNGQKVVSLSGYTTEYVEVELPEAAAAALRAGRNVLAIACRQTGGGQYIDAGILEAAEP